MFGIFVTLKIQKENPFFKFKKHKQLWKNRKNTLKLPG